MASRIIGICDAIVAEINAEFGANTASRGYAPILKVAPEPGELVDGLSEKQVRVIPRTRASERVSRNTRAYDYELSIGVYQVVAVDAGTGEPLESEVDGLVEFCELIEDFFLDHHEIAGLENHAIVSEATTLIYDFESMRTSREFRAFVTTKVRQTILG